MSDYIIQGTAANQQVRFFAATTKELVEKAKNTHTTSPVATAALGRLLTAGAMMGSMCKNDTDILTLQIQCSGPIGGLIVTADANANVKGYVFHPDILLPPNKAGKLDVGRALDLGVLSVIKDIGMKEPYVGQTQLVSGEIAEDLTYYFANSEQVPTSVALGVLMEKDNTVKQAGGFIIQLMPFASEELITALEERLAEFTSITSLLDQGMSPEDIIGQLFKGFDYTIHKTMPCKFHCDCSRDRVSKALIAMGRQELNSMIQEKKSFDLNCHFCNKCYTFSTQDLINLINYQPNDKK